MTVIVYKKFGNIDRESVTLGINNYFILQDTYTIIHGYQYSYP